MKSFKMTLAVALAAVLTMTVSAQAAELFHTTGSGGTWNNSGSWQWQSGTGAHTNYPQAGDTAVILEGDAVTISTGNGVAACAVLTIEDSNSTAGSLSIQTDGELRVSSSITVENSLTNPGVFEFNATSGTNPPRLSAFDADVELAGPITVAGSKGGVIASNLVTDYFELESSGIITAVSGPLTIDATMRIDGTVRANATSPSNYIEFTVAPDASSTGKLECVGHANARMIFDFHDAITVAMDLEVALGQVQMKQDCQLTLAGGIHMSNDGSVVAEAGNTVGPVPPGKLRATGAYTD